MVSGVGYCGLKKGFDERRDDHPGPLARAVFLGDVLAHYLAIVHVKNAGQSILETAQELRRVRSYRVMVRRAAFDLSGVLARSEVALRAGEDEHHVQLQGSFQGCAR